MYRLLKCCLLFSIMLVLGCNGKKKYHTAAQEIEKASSDKLKSILAHRLALNEEFKNPNTSPLIDRHRKDFEGLDFFAPDTSFIIKAKLVAALNTSPFLMPTTTERMPEYVLFGTLHFTLKGKECVLEVYQDQKLMLEEGYEDYLFLPFMDKTNGNETYGGGRYIDLSIPKVDTLIIDFNKAYNPYCAYNKKYSCPIVPVINTLDLEIPVGVKAYAK